MPVHVNVATMFLLDDPDRLRLLVLGFLCQLSLCVFRMAYVLGSSYMSAKYVYVAVGIKIN